MPRASRSAKEIGTDPRATGICIHVPARHFAKTSRARSRGHNKWRTRRGQSARTIPRTRLFRETLAGCQSENDFLCFLKMLFPRKATISPMSMIIANTFVLGLPILPETQDCFLGKTRNVPRCSLSLSLSQVLAFASANSQRACAVSLSAETSAGAKQFSANRSAQIHARRV